MSEIGRRIDQVIRLDLGVRLRRHRYRKHARTLYAQGDQQIKLVNVQASQWNTGIEGRFTLNLGVHWPQIHEILERAPLGRFPKEYECTPCSIRIGHLMPDGRDHRWQLNPATDPASLAEEVGLSWEHYGHPWLEDVSDPEGALKWLLSQGQEISASALSLYLGRTREAADLLNRALVRLAKHPEDRRLDQWQAWGRRQHLLPDEPQG
jgi:hypothetical protein